MREGCVRFFDAVVATVSHLLHVLAIDVHSGAGKADGHELIQKTQLLKHGQDVDILFRRVCAREWKLESESRGVERE